MAQTTRDYNPQLPSKAPVTSTNPPYNKGDLERIFRSGGHFVLCRKDKRPLRRLWQKQPATLVDVLAHATAGGLLGVKPGTLGIAAIDVDFGSIEAVEKIISPKLLGAPLTYYRTQRPGGYHIFYKAADPEAGNRKWAFHGGSGDLRAGNGFIILWNAKAFRSCLKKLTAAREVNVYTLPKSEGIRTAATPTDRVANAVKGTRNTVLNTVAHQLAKSGQLKAGARLRLVQAAALSGLGKDEAEATVASALAAVPSETGTPGAENYTPEKTRRGEDEDGFVACLADFNLELRENTLALMDEIRRTGNSPIPNLELNEWTEVTDKIDGRIYCAIQKTFLNPNEKPLAFSAFMWGKVFLSVLQGNQVNPLKDWLLGLPAWDGVPRVNEALGKCFSLPGKNQLHQWVSRFCFLGVVWRTMEPGCKLDEFPILVGRPDSGKSTWVAQLLPQSREGLKWTGEGLNLAADQKRRVEFLQGKAVVEVSDMAGSTKAEINSLKAFISCTNDGGVRLSFRKNPKSSPRKCILIGTSNELSGCLPNDPYGLRRFAAIRVDIGANGVGGIYDYMKKNREQIYAEALVMYRDKQPASIPPELKNLQAQLAEEHRQADPLVENKLTEVLAQNLESLSHPLGFTMAEILQAAGVVPPGHTPEQVLPALAHRFARGLKLKGYVNVRVARDGVSVRVWRFVG